LLRQIYTDSVSDSYRIFVHASEQSKVGRASDALEELSMIAAEVEKASDAEASQDLGDSDVSEFMEGQVVLCLDDAGLVGLCLMHGVRCYKLTVNIAACYDRPITVGNGKLLNTS
jgi:hypothetical protein